MQVESDKDFFKDLEKMTQTLSLLQVLESEIEESMDIQGT